MTNKDLHAILLYGPTSTGKSVFISCLIRVLLAQLPPGTKARVVTTEHFAAYRELAKEGLAEVWKINTVDHPFESARFAMDGLWPTVVVDGVADPTSPLDRRGKSLINVFEGVATLGEYISGNYAEGGLSDRIGRGETFGALDEKAGPVRIQDGTVAIGKLSSPNYGFIQGNLTNYIQRSQRLGGYNIWSTHEDDVEQKVGNEYAKTLRKTGQIIIGPQGFGAAMTQTMGRDFDDMWRFHSIPRRVTVQGDKDRVWVERRLYVKDHVCPTFGVLAKAKNSASGDDVPEYFRLTTKEEDEGGPGNRRKDAAQVVKDRIGI